MSLFAPFIVQHCNTILTGYPELPGRAILGLKWPICPKHNFFWKAINKISLYLWAPFIVFSFKKILKVYPELWGCTIFGPKIVIFGLQMIHFLEQVFFGKTINITFMYLFAPSIVQNFKKNLGADLRLWGAQQQMLYFNPLYTERMRGQWLPLKYHNFFLKCKHQIPFYWFTGVFNWKDEQKEIGIWKQ